MNAILILLAMFSVTWVLSNLSFLDRAKAFSFLSIPLLLGLAMSPEGLIPILPSTRTDLSWALRVALTWTSFLLGSQLIGRGGPRLWGRLISISLAYLLYALVTLLLLSLLEVQESALAWNLQSYPPEALAMAILLSSALFSSEENPFLLTLTLASLFFIFPLFTPLHFLLSIGIGLLLALVCRLVVATDKKLDTPARLTLLGICILGTGWAVAIDGLEILIGLTWGWMIALIHGPRLSLDTKLNLTEAPTRFALALFTGLFTVLSWKALLVGLGLAFVRLLVKWLLLNSRLRRTEDIESLNSLLPIAKMAMPIMLGLHLSFLQGELSTFLLSSFAIGFVANDLLILVMEVYKKNLITGTEVTA